MDKKISELTQVESIEGIELLAVVQSSETKSATVNQVIEGLAKEDDIPTKTSDLTNDSGFITENDIPDIPTKTSDLENDSGFITSSAISGMVKSVNNETPDSDGNVELTIPTYTAGAGIAISSSNVISNTYEEPDVDKAYVDGALATKQDTLVSGTTIKTINGNNLLGSGNIVIQGGSGETYTAGDGIDITNNVISNTYSDPDVDKAYVDAGLADKQDTLVSGTNIKTINGSSILTSGNIDVLTETKVTTITSASTDAQIPSAKAVYDLFNSIADVTSVTW